MKWRILHKGILHYQKKDFIKFTINSQGGAIEHDDKFVKELLKLIKKYYEVKRYEYRKSDKYKRGF